LDVLNWIEYAERKIIQIFENFIFEYIDLHASAMPLLRFDEYKSKE